MTIVFNVFYLTPTSSLNRLCRIARTGAERFAQGAAQSPLTVFKCEADEGYRVVWRVAGSHRQGPLASRVDFKHHPHRVLQLTALGMMSGAPQDTRQVSRNGNAHGMRWQESAYMKLIKESPILRSIPVVILTTCASDADILRSYMLHANCYITKPVDLRGFLTVVKSIDAFWFSVVKLPHMPDL